MKFIDIIIVSLSVIGLVYFALERFKYSNIETYYKKLERLNEICEISAIINYGNSEAEEIIKSMNADTFFTEEMTDKLIAYRDNEDKLRYLKDEQKEIERYLKNARIYMKNSGDIP